jgi:pyridoxine 4-dehydrogenase
MAERTTARPAEASGTLIIGGDLNVVRLGFGAMRITGTGIWGPPSDKQEAIATLRRVPEVGINLIDTADSYGPNVSEELIAEALYPYPRDLVIATKGGLLRTGPGAWPIDGRPEHLREALEGSLRRLRLDRIDIYQYHRPDPRVPFEDSVGELARLRGEGKIRHVGLSNITIEQLTSAQKIVPIVVVQNHYSLERRQSERMTHGQSEEMIDLCARLGIGFIPWGPLDTGTLGQQGGILEHIGRRHEMGPRQVALAWMLQRSPTMLPIPGTSSVRHLEENVRAAQVRVSREEYDAIDRASAV